MRFSITVNDKEKKLTLSVESPSDSKLLEFLAEHEDAKVVGTRNSTHRSSMAYVGRDEVKPLDALTLTLHDKEPEGVARPFEVNIEGRQYELHSSGRDLTLTTYSDGMEGEYKLVAIKNGVQYDLKPSQRM